MSASCSSKSTKEEFDKYLDARLEIMEEIDSSLDYLNIQIDTLKEGLVNEASRSIKLNEVLTKIQTIEKRLLRLEDSEKAQNNFIINNEISKNCISLLSHTRINLLPIYEEYFKARLTSKENHKNNLDINEQIKHNQELIIFNEKLMKINETFISSLNIYSSKRTNLIFMILNSYKTN